MRVSGFFLKICVIAMMVGCVGFISSGCGMDDGALADVRKASVDASALAQAITAEREQLNKAKSATKIPNFAAIAVREKLEEEFITVDAKMADVTSCADDLAGFADRDKSREQEAAVKRAVACLALIAEMNALYKEPMRRLLRWEHLFSQAPQMKAQAHQEYGVAQAAMNQLLVPSGVLVMKAAKQELAYPHKRDDIEKRIVEIRTAYDTLVEHLQDVDEQATAVATGGAFDVGDFEDAVDGVDEFSGTVEDTVEDLDDRLDQLDETYALVLVSVQKIPTCKWQEACEDWGWRSERGRGWMDVPCDQWNNMRLDTETRSQGYEFSDSGYVCWVEDFDVTYAHYSTTYEMTASSRSNATRADVDENTWHDHYEAIQRLNEMFPDYGLIIKRDVSGVLDEGDPVAVYIETKGVVLEEKAIGMYEGEATDMPSLLGMHLNLVGNEEFGSWIGNGAQKRWMWDERHAKRWSEQEQRQPHGGGLNNFWTGYMMARLLDSSRGDYYGYYGSGYYDRYHDWRIRDGYDSHRWGSDGRRVTTPASYTVGGGSHVRGAGPRSRSRGMGGGGK